MTTFTIAGIIFISIATIVVLSACLFNQQKRYHLLSLQIAQVLEQSRGMESIATIDLGPWMESCLRDPHAVWGKSFLMTAYSNLAKYLPSLSVLFVVETENRDENLPQFVAGNIEPVLELILCELLSHDRKAMRVAPVELNRFGVNDHRTQLYEVISGIRLTIWIGSKRPLSNDTWDQITRYGAEIQRLLAILILKRRAKDSSQRKDSQLMLQQVSHDIRSPLHNMKSALILAGEQKGLDIDEYLQVALKNLDCISELTETILDFSSVSSGVIESSFEPVPIQLFIDDIVERYSVAAAMKGLELRSDVSIQHSVLFDRRHLDRVVSNLISNAIKYSSKGAISISAFLSAQETLSISITDQGIGLTSDQLTKLFTPFTRFQRHLAPGAGLGLSFAKQLVELNSGELTVESVFGQGSTFTVAARRAIGNTKSDDVRSIRSLNGIKVLFIEDDIDLRLSLERLLKLEGLEVFCAQNFIEAQSIFQFESVHCVISDLETGEGSLNEFLTSESFVSRATPVLLLSGSHLAVVPDGVHSMVRKPPEMEAILQWVREVTEARAEQYRNFKELAA